MNKVLVYNKELNDVLSVHFMDGTPVGFAELNKVEHAGKQAMVSLHKAVNNETEVFQINLPASVTKELPAGGLVHAQHSSTIKINLLNPTIGDRGKFMLSVIYARQSGSSKQQIVAADFGQGVTVEQAINQLVDRLNEIPFINATFTKEENIGTLLILVDALSDFDVIRASLTETFYSNNEMIKTESFEVEYGAPTVTLDAKANTLYRRNYSVMTGRNIIESGGVDAEEAAKENIKDVVAIIGIRYSTRTTSTSPIAGGAESFVETTIICIGEVPA